jgi:mRNA-degrading endonuclease RelE of RelBE toxin-antitoxin system
MAWTLIVAKPAQKQAARFPAKDQAKIAAALRAMADDPFAGDVLKLEGEKDRCCRRVGNYRIFFAVDRPALMIAVSAIVRRTSTTY